jgi:hypothetical protein
MMSPAFTRVVAGLFAAAHAATAQDNETITVTAELPGVREKASHEYCAASGKQVQNPHIDTRSRAAAGNSMNASMLWRSKHRLPRH